MKVTVEFNIEQDSSDVFSYECFLASEYMAEVINDFTTYLREETKYSSNPASIEEVRQKWLDMLNDKKLQEFM